MISLACVEAPKLCGNVSLSAFPRSWTVKLDRLPRYYDVGDNQGQRGLKMAEAEVKAAQ